eukprot:GGOE01031482.1.p1 GENE.GGOE01031482.1~~GGOE01031482.1.p1  ORF type:complete len:303 (-),score=51.43 GGOE01031482.1:352-1170(-)
MNADIDVAALLAQLNLSDPHCNEGSLDFESLSGGPPQIMFSSSRMPSSSSLSSLGNVSPTSSFDMDSMQSMDTSIPFGDLPTVMAEQPHTNSAPGTPLAAIGPSSHDGSRYKTVLCLEWKCTRTCRFGDRCEFAHGEKELRTSSENQVAATFLAHLATRFSKGKAGAPSAPHRSAARKLPASVTPPPSPPAMPILVAAAGQSPIMPGPPSYPSAAAPPLGRVDAAHLSIESLHLCVPPRLPLRQVCMGPFHPANPLSWGIPTNSLPARHSAP